MSTVLRHQTVTSTRGFRATALSSSQPGTVIQSLISCPTLGTRLNPPTAIYLFPFVIISLTFSPISITIKPGCGQKPTSESYRINSSVGALLAILGNDKKCKWDLIPQTNNYKIRPRLNENDEDQKPSLYRLSCLAQDWLI